VVGLSRAARCTSNVATRYGTAIAAEVSPLQQVADADLELEVAAHAVLEAGRGI
jgi:hypothetical protein